MVLGNTDTSVKPVVIQFVRQRIRLRVAVAAEILVSESRCENSIWNRKSPRK